MILELTLHEQPSIHAVEQVSVRYESVGDQRCTRGRPTPTYPTISNHGAAMSAAMDSNIALHIAQHPHNTLH